MSPTPMRAAYPAAPPTPQHPNPGQLASFRAQLEEQLQFRLDQLAQLRAIDPHDISEVAQVLAAGARAALQAVLGALDRLDDGTFGVCTDCGTRLQLERLEVLPQAGQCLPCRRDAAVRSAATPDR